MSTKIRIASIEDLASLINVDEIAKLDGKRVELLTKAIKDSQCYVYDEGNDPVGYSVLDYSWYDCGFIRMLYVHRDHRRHGVGESLIQDIERRCATAKLFTSTNRSNVPMQKLLSKLGFIESGFIDNLDSGDPEVVYFKNLSKKK